MPRLLCPRCSKTFTHDGGDRALCPHCGYTATAPGAALSAPAPLAAPGFAGMPPPPGPAPTAPGARPPGTNGLAIASFVFGLLSLLGGFFLVFPPVLGFTFGLVSLRQMRATGQAGLGLAITGLVLSGMVLTAYLGLFFVFLVEEII